MIADPNTLYKLMILYILNASEFPLNNSQVCEFLLEKGYTTYFTTQAAISDLIEAQFISVKQQNKSPYYQLTTSGFETLELPKRFRRTIPTTTSSKATTIASAM